MTLPELQTLPDSELNALAARLVMGWTLIPKSEPYDFPMWWHEDIGWGPHPPNYCADRNQSGELLAWMVGRGAEFQIGVDGIGEIDYVTFTDSEQIWGNVPGNDARAETIAALMAHFALEGKA